MPAPPASSPAALPTSAAVTTQERTGRPSTSTVHAPADALAAAGLGGGQSQLIAEHRQQRSLRPAGRARARRRLRAPRPLYPRSSVMMAGMSGPPERAVRVSTLELFFDLVFVFTITQLTGVLVSGGDAAAALQVLVMLLIALVDLRRLRVADEHHPHGAHPLSPDADLRDGRLPRDRARDSGCVRRDRPSVRARLPRRGPPARAPCT